MRPHPIVTFTSDFGTREYYVGAVKGAVLSACPQAHIVDISHDVGAHDLLEGAFTLFGAYSAFPTKTVHLVVIDPGVGSQRRAIIAVTENHFFVAPDNGVLSLVFEREEVSRVVAIQAEHYFSQPVAPTFHGRDIFGPIAGHLARGISAATFGPTVTDFVKLSLPAPRKVGAGEVEGIVLHIDRFGNVITNLSTSGIQAAVGDGTPTRFRAGKASIDRFVTYYAEAGPNELVGLIGSSGFYEIAALKKPAARLLEVKRGSPVRLKVG